MYGQVIICVYTDMCIDAEWHLVVYLVRPSLLMLHLLQKLCYSEYGARILIHVEFEWNGMIVFHFSVLFLDSPGII
jgi:hypothetical protein